MDRIVQVDDVIQGPFKVPRIYTQDGVLYFDLGNMQTKREFLVTSVRASYQEGFLMGHNVRAVVLKRDNSIGDFGIAFSQGANMRNAIPLESITLTGRFGYLTEKQRLPEEK